MNERDGSLREGDLNLNILFQLLGDKETNYGFFAVSRIRVISKIIGNHSQISRTKKDKGGTGTGAKKICNKQLTLL